MTRSDHVGHEGDVDVALQMKRWLLVALGLGFGGLTVDVFLEHYFAIRSIRAQQWIPIIFGPLAAATALVTAWRFAGVMLRLFAVASWVSIGVGLVGLYFHGHAVTRTVDTFSELLDWQTLLGILPHAPPLGAPTAFVGMGVLGLLIHTCAVKLEHMAAPRTQRAYAISALAFLLLVVAPLSPVLIHLLF